MKKTKKILLIFLSVAIVISGIAFYDVFSKTDFVTAFIFTADSTPEPTPTPQPTIKPQETTKFIGVGDNLIHGMLYMQANNRANGNGYDFDYAYENIEYYFDDFDIKFINQETLVNDAFKPSTYPQFSSPLELGQKVVDMGFNAIGMSNNHSYDKGPDGIRSSLDFWSRQKDLVYFGFYTGDDENEIKYLDINGVRVAFLAYTRWTNGLSIADESCPQIVFTYDYDTIERQVKIAKENADIVIASCHWGYEETNQIIDEQKEAAQKLNEFGVDAIIGTHPHVIQTVEWIENPENGHKTIVCYSLGNFISAQSTANTMLGGMFQFDIVKTYTDLEDNYTVSIKNPKFVPTVTHYDANYSNVRNYLLKDYSEELANVHGVRAFEPVFSIEFMENIINKYIPQEFLLYK
ncbi:MAG: CapA family protein [Oscillospiraceae bacterium]|nr:CapA family protein [Oscillospiraceae bacterium]